MSAAHTLRGTRVLDLSIWRPGPYATSLLASLGADVIKVEPPGGDPMRHFPELFEELNAGKRSICLDLRTDRDRARLSDLVAGADVVVEAFRPGVAARLGVGHETVRTAHPSVVYCSISGFGQTGPLVAVPGHDLSYQAWSGVMTPMAPPAGTLPPVPPVPIGDLSSGLLAFGLISAALAGRATTGEGRHLEVSIADTLASWTGATSGGGLADGSLMRELPSYGTYACADGRLLALAFVTEDPFWVALCQTLRCTELADLDVGARMARVDELRDQLAHAIAQQPRDALLAVLLAAGVPAAPVLTREEMLADPHFRARGTVREPSPGDIRIGFPALVDGEALPSLDPAPALDAHPAATWN
jgi:crotonobetainyl-CoA:carnitine CoA-transferase CaiB-like acyl-CoA transferase